MGQVFTSLQASVNRMWASLRAQPRSNVAGYINPRLRTSLTAAHSTPRQVPNASKIQGLQKVRNLRDLAEACPNIAPGRIMRSACPSNANEADIDTIRQKLGITQLVDLRSGFERSEDPDSLLTRDADLRVSKRSGRMATMERFEPADQNTDGAGAPPLIVQHLSLLERSRYYKAILLKIPFAASAYALFWMPFDSARGKSAIMKEINKGGLPMLYEIIIEIAGPEIKCALEVITEAAEAGNPLLFFCRVGKDRTGVLAALLLACCGAKPGEIIADYHRSDNAVGEIALGGLEKEDKELHQLDFAVFSKAPAEVMAAFLTHLDDTYGGPLGYLDSIGFSKKQQTRLKQAVCITGSQTATL